MKILIACERSGIVRDAFLKKNHEAISCDIEPTITPGPHITEDVLDILDQGWDMMIAHPPCTHLAVSGARHFPEKRKDGRQQEAIDFFMALVNAPVEMIAIENPVGIMSRIYKKPSQIIQPWFFGHGETKATCLWLKNLAPLMSTKLVSGRDARIHRLSPGPNRSFLRSITYQGIAAAMADQWG